MNINNNKNNNPCEGEVRVVLEKFPAYFFIGCLIFSFIALLLLFRPFLIVLVLAAILGTFFRPLYKRVLTLFRGRSRAASLFTCFLILVLFIIPVSFFILLLVRQAIDTSNFVLDQLQTGKLDYLLKWEKGHVLYDFFRGFQARFGSTVDLQSIDLKENLRDVARNVSPYLDFGSYLVKQSAGFLKGLALGFINIFILFFALYYFLKDAPLLIKKLMKISPLPMKHNLELLNKFKEISTATLIGIFLTSIIQGIIGGLGFFVVGIPNALLWGTAIAFFSLIPIVGTSLIWLPASIILLLSGNTVGGIVLFFWGILLVSTIDNFLRAYLIGNRVKMNPLLTFLAVFGGITLFGLIGVILGPLILMLFFTFLHIYELEYKPSA
jgi:predicted PurR-regulated permease PerM